MSFVSQLELFMFVPGTLSPLHFRTFCGDRCGFAALKVFLNGGLVAFNIHMASLRLALNVVAVVLGKKL